jgi:hypothetical protein
LQRHGSRDLGIAVSNQNLFQKEIKKELNSDNAFYHSVQNYNFACRFGWVSDMGRIWRGEYLNQRKLKWQEAEEAA